MDEEDPTSQQISADLTAGDTEMEVKTEGGLTEVSLKAVSIDDEKCTKAVSDVAELARNLNVDPYSEDETEMRFLYSKPTCFLLMGKPGVGKTTLARRFAAEWKCELINSTDIIQQNMDFQTEIGIKCLEILHKGEAIPEDMVLKMIEDKVNSPEVAHHGYAMDDFPCLGEELMSIKDQLELIKSWKLKPDFLINLRIPEKDIERRRQGQKIDPTTQDLYTRDVYNPDKAGPPPSPDREDEDEEEEEEAEDEEEGGGEDEEPQIELPLEVMERLIKRPEDLHTQVDENLGKYKTNMLRILEDYMADHDQQYLIEMDGNQTVLSLFKQLMQKLLTFVLRPAAIVTRLNDPEEEEMPEDMETEELLRGFAPKQMVAPRYRWRRSRWLRNCPVALFEGNILPGKPEFAVSFLDKIYCLSSAEAIEKFVKNPRPYLLPEQPRPPCKLSVIGAPGSGKTTLSNLIAHKYGGKVFEITELTSIRREEDKRKLIEQTRKEATETAINTVRLRIKEQLEAEAAAREEERLIRLAEEAAREQEEQEDEEGEEGGAKSRKESDAVDADKSGNADAEKSSEEAAGEEKTGSEEPKTGADSGSQATAAPSGENLEEDQPAPPPPEPEVDETHPDVIQMVKVAVAEAEAQVITLTPEIQVEVLDEAIKEWEKELRSRKPEGPLHGCWILDNFPSTREQWNACVEKNFLPDDVIVLGDDGGESKTNLFQSLAERFARNNREFLLEQMEKREQLRLEREEQARIEEARRIEAEEQRKKDEREAERIKKEEELAAAELADELLDAGVKREEEATEEVSKVEAEAEAEVEPEPAQPDAPERNDEDGDSSEKEDSPEPPVKTELELLMEQPEVLAFIEKLKEAEKELTNLLATITGTSTLEPFNLAVGTLTPEEILSEVCKHLERLFKYIGWEMGAPDIDEEEEDLEAETLEAEEDAPEDEEAAEEEEEDPNRSIKKKFLGDSNYFDPVTLNEQDILNPGNPEQAAVYREKVYYFSSPETREKFLEEPTKYLTMNRPLKPPPVRLLILGARGSGKTMHGRYLAEKLGIFHISFRERLQELIIAKTKKKVGPEFEEEEEEQPEEEEEDSDLEEDAENKETSDAEVAQDAQSASDLKQPEATIAEEEEEEPELTEDEEAIKANLESSDPLPPELLDNIMSGWWNKEPFKSTGFILEGFPRTSDEVKYLQESGLFPDAAVILQVSEDDVIGRLLPPKLDKWKAKRDKRLAKKAKKKEKAQKKRDAAMAKRREELVKDKEERRAAKQAEKDQDDSENDEEMDEEEEEDEEDDIEAVLAEEFEEEEEEEEEDEEQEEDAVERMRNDFNEIYDDDTNRLSAVEETLEEVLIPRLDITAGRKPHIVRYIFNKKLKPYVDYRHSIFERVYPLNERQAKRMLQVGYKQPSRFGRWDPVKMKDGDCIQPMSGPGYQTFPCFYRSHIYFLSSRQNQQMFMQNPMTFLVQESPKPVVPIKIAIIGPPKSGKTSLANRFVEDYGVVRLSIGEAMRQVMTMQSNSELAKQINWHLLRGRVVPDDLQVQALETVLLDMRSQTRGFVLDGFPMTRKQIDMMTERSIIPVRIIELELASKGVMVRGVKDRCDPTRTIAVHDSAKILAIKLSCYLKTVPEVRDWYHKTHQNHRAVASDESKWWVWDSVNELATSSVKRIQDYLQRVGEAKAAGIADLCITPTEFDSRLGDFGQYCPVSLAEWGELVDCAIAPTLKYGAEFRGHYYKMAGEKELNMFLSEPEKYVPPIAPKKLPPPELLPKRVKKADLIGKKPQIQGYCSVTYLDGKLRYESLLPGSDEFAAEYKEQIFLMQDEEKLFRFMKTPEKYAHLKLPHKLPPREEDLPLVNLPMLGFMEQTSAVAMVKALTACGNVKPKYPFVTSTRSALIYIAYHLKAYNPKSSPYIRKKYKQKLQQFEETCELIKYLGNNMTVRYRDPNERPKDFDSKLETFFALRGLEPTPTWIA